MIGSATLFKPDGAFDAAAAAAARPQLDQLVEGNADVLVDLSAVEFIDSSGIGAIVFLFKRLTAKGRQLRLSGVHGQPLQLMEFLRIPRVIPFEAATP